MWSLPDIKELNKRAKASKKVLLKTIRTGKETGKGLECDYADHGDCEGAVRAIPYFDIFSDDPKGLIKLCEKHDGYFGSPAEGYFECGRCDRVFIDENYTWENYYHVNDCDGRICLNCYARQVIGDARDPGWLKTDGSEKVDFQRIRRAPHIIAAKGPTYGLKFLGNTEFDNTTGGCISGGGTEEIRELLKKAKKRGYTRALVVLDATYQFAVLVGVYVNPQDKKDQN